MDKKEITENKENVVIDDFDFSMIADFFKRVDKDLVASGRQGLPRV